VWTSTPNQFVRSETVNLAPGTALDLACGEGRNAVWLAGQGWRATGVDFSTAGLAKAQTMAERAGVEAEWIHADVLHWRPDEAWDLVLLAYLQVACEGRQAAIAAAADAVGVGGTLLVIAHDLRNLTEGVGGPHSAGVLWRAADIDAFLGTSRGSEFTARSVGVRERRTEAGSALDLVANLTRTTSPSLDRRAT
jgi:SAM-dependent methyltransferase